MVSTTLPPGAVGDTLDVFGGTFIVSFLYDLFKDSIR